MEYYLTKYVDITYEEAIVRATEELKKEGFGILTEIDVKDNFKEKIGIDFRKYIILGACNPPYAYQALEAEDKVGVLLPCNVVVQETEEGKTEVSAVNPLVAMSMIENSTMEIVAKKVHDAIQRVLDHL